MNTDITFCNAKSCVVKKYCKRSAEIRESDLLISYSNFDCMNSEESFFLDANLPIVVYEFSQALMDELVELRKFKLDSNTNSLNLEGLLTDGYTFICPEHGLHPNCDCQDNQIKVWNDTINNPEEVIKFAEFCGQSYDYHKGVWIADDINRFTTEELYKIYKDGK